MTEELKSVQAFLRQRGDELLALPEGWDTYGGVLPDACWCCGEPAPVRGEGDPWEGRMDGYCTECAITRCDTSYSTCTRRRHG